MVMGRKLANSSVEEQPIRTSKLNYIKVMLKC